MPARRPAEVLASRALEAAVVALAAAPVLFFGGVHVWFVAGAFLAAAALAAAALATAGLGRASLSPALPAALVPAAAILAFGAVQAAAGLTLSRAATHEALLRAGTAALVLALAATAARSDRAVRRMALGVVALGAFEALYGIAEHFSGHEHILLWPKTHPGTVTGTLVNRNHFAGVVAAATPIALALATAQPRAWRREIPRLRVRLAVAAGEPAFWKCLLLLGTAALCALATLLSLSRGGVLALAAALATFAALSGRGRRAWALAAPAGLVAAALAGLLWFGADPLVNRFAGLVEQTTSAGASRLSFARATVALIAERPLAGAGLGSFELAHLRTQVGWFGGLRVDHAHMDFLQVAAEVGVPLLLALVGGVLLTIVRALRRSPPGPESVVAGGLAAALAAIAAQAFVDFNLQLLGPLCLAALVLGLLAGPTAPRPQVRGAPARVLALAAILGLAALVPAALRVLRAEAAVRPTVRAQDDDRDASARLAALEGAIALRPEKAAYRLAAAEERLRAARPGEEVAALRPAVEDLRAARAAEPSNPYVLAELARRTPDRAEAGSAADAAVAAFPNGAETRLDAAIGRLRFDPADPRGRGWLGDALALDLRLLERAARTMLALGAVDVLGDALPETVEAHRRLAVVLHARRTLEPLRRQLDRLARVEEKAPQGDPITPAAAPEPAAIPASAWRDGPSPEARPLAPPDAPAVRVHDATRAHAWIGAAGPARFEASTMPGQPVALVCVRLDGRHLGHHAVRDGWQPLTIAAPAPGWLEVRPALPAHGIAPAGAVVLLR